MAGDSFEVPEQAPDGTPVYPVDLELSDVLGRRCLAMTPHEYEDLRRWWYDVDACLWSSVTRDEWLDRVDPRCVDEDDDEDGPT